MDRELPAWQPFDPGEPGSGIAFSPQDDEGPARMVVVLASPDVVEESWAPRAAVALVRQLASNEGRTLLADLDLMEPRLHESLGVSNHEGVSDVFLWGASFQRVARSVEPGLLFAPAGTVVADPAAVAESPRWDTVADGVRQARATLALYVPHDAPGAEALLGRATDVVVLSTPEGVAGLDVGPWAGRVRAVLGPMVAGTVVAVEEAVGGGSEAPAHDEERPATGPPAAGDHEEARSLTEPAGVAARSAAAASGQESTERRLDPRWEEEVTRAVSAAETRGSRPVMWLALALLVAVAVIAAAWADWVEIPYLSPLLGGGAATAVPEEEVVRGASEPGPDSPAAAAAREGGGEAGGPGAEPAATPEVAAAGAGGPGAEAPGPAGDATSVQRFSVAIASYPDAASALEARQDLSSRRPDLPFIVAPVEVGGRVHHRLLAGLAADPPAVQALQGSLSGTFGEADAQRWIVREAGRAYLLGEAASLEEARARAGELAAGGVQPYVLAVDGAEGPLYRVYAGAYADADEAAALGTLLEGQGLGDAPLVPRIGRLPG